MSKEKPEVGDVWREKCLEIEHLFLEIEKGGVYVLTRYSDNTKDVGFIDREDYKNLKYIGKSKMKIEELFDVEDME